jgi:hypothetical protein
MEVGIEVGDLTARLLLEFPLCLFKTSGTSVTPPPRFSRLSAARVRDESVEAGAQAVRARPAGSKPAKKSFQSAQENPCVRSAASSGVACHFRRRI